MYRSRFKQSAFEDYLCLYCNKRANDLTLIQLKQILGVHGFKRLKGVNKENIQDAVRSLDLIPPTRSTVHNESVQLCSGEARLAQLLEEMNYDIKQLGWAECSIGSVATLLPSAQFAANEDTSNNPIPRPRVYKVYMRRCKDKMKKKESPRVYKVYLRRCKDNVKKKEREEGEEDAKFKEKMKKKRRAMKNAKSKGTSTLLAVTRSVRVSVEESKNYDRYCWLCNGKRK